MSVITEIKKHSNTNLLRRELGVPSSDSFHWSPWPGVTRTICIADNNCRLQVDSITTDEDDSFQRERLIPGPNGTYIFEKPGPLQVIPSMRNRTPYSVGLSAGQCMQVKFHYKQETEEISEADAQRKIGEYVQEIRNAKASIIRS